MTLEDARMVLKLPVIWSKETVEIALKVLMHVRPPEERKKDRENSNRH
jgi:hypothetical protein